MQEIVIKLSKTKMLVLLAGSIGFVAVGFWLWQIADVQHRYFPLYVKFAATLSIGFFGLGAVFIFVKLFDSNPGLIINDEGITDNASGASAGLVRWENITKVRITEIVNQKFITIDVNNADEILNRQSDSKRAMMQQNIKLCNSPVNISTNMLQCNFQKLYDLIKEEVFRRDVMRKG